MPDNTFRFSPIVTREEQLTVAGETAWLNGPATNRLAELGKFINITADTEKKAIRIVPSDSPGPWNFKIVPGIGTAIRLRGRLGHVGMPKGRYINIGSDIFQHIDYIGK